MQYNCHFGGEHQLHSPRFQALTVTYELPFLRQLLQQEDNRAVSELANAIETGQAFVADKKGMKVCTRIADCVNAILGCRLTGSLKYMYLESKMMELFVLQMEQCGAERYATRHASWSKVDREKLNAVKEFVERNFMEEFSLRDLTYRFGLNEFKLKKGYKELFKTTVFGHVHQLRMLKANSLLSSGTTNVSETAFQLGYQNVSSFCTEYKKHFGYSPGNSIGS